MKDHNSFLQRGDEPGSTYMVLWSLPADGSSHSLMTVDAETWLSFIEPDAKPSGEKQPV